jgi:alpha-maltose-1-phosphate synthase
MVIVSHPTGNAFSHNLALALEEAGLLSEFCTCLDYRPTAWEALLPHRVLATLRRRSVPMQLRNKVHTAGIREAARLLAGTLHVDRFSRPEVGLLSMDKVCAGLDEHVALRLRQASEVRAVYAYEDAAERTFEAARALGMHRIYDLPIGYWRTGRRIQEEEARLLPEWASTMPALADSERKLKRKDSELRNASTVVVPSSFVKESLKDAPFPLPHVAVVPFGSPVPLECGRDNSQRRGRELNVIFVGSLTQRKGIAYLFEAAERMKSRLRLTIIGRKTGECAALNRALKKHRWIPSAPHEVVLDEIARSDVLVLPSVFDGFGLVMTEALSRSVPVIATTHTGAPDLFENGEGGYIVPVRSSTALEECLERFLADPALLGEQRRRALAVAQKFTWGKYCEEVVALVRGMVREG